MTGPDGVGVPQPQIGDGTRFVVELPAGLFQRHMMGVHSLQKEGLQQVLAFLVGLVD
jgi:hypothetical protein